MSWFFNTYNPSTPTEGGNLFLQTAFSEQNHSKKIVGVIRVNTYNPSTPTEGGNLFLQTAFSEQNHSKKIVGVIRVKTVFTTFGLDSTYMSFMVFGKGKRLCTSEECVDACLDAMEEGAEHVCMQDKEGFLLWERFPMLPRQWNSVCRLLEGAGVGCSVVWRENSLIYYTKTETRDIEYLWTDLEAVQAYVKFLTKRFCQAWRAHQSWIAHELDRRVTWEMGLRRAWLAGVVE